MAYRQFTQIPPRLKFKKNSALRLLRADAALPTNVLPGVEAVGAGYNPFLEYASADSITVQLFDWNKCSTKPVIFKPAYVIPAPVDAQQADAATYTNSTGESVNKFQKDLANTVKVGGSYNFFSGSLSVEYTEQSLVQSENEFTRIQQSISLWSLRLAVTADLRNYLRDDFKDHLDTLPCNDTAAEQFFNTFGSHFLTGVVMGGRAVLASATNKLTVSRKYSVEVVAEASYKGMTGQLTASDRTKYQESMDSFRRNSETNHFVQGGDGVAAASVFNGADGFDRWKATVGTSPDFVNFVSANPMAEIWRLCKAGSAQAAFLENYYNTKWAPTQSAKAQRYPNYVDALAVVTGGNSQIPAPSGYTKIPYDLNAEAGGDFIYLCFHEEMFHSSGPNKDCIVDLKVIFDKDATPPGFTKIDQDLNKGAGGKYVYLCYKKAAYDDAKAIKSVTVIGGNSAEVPAPYGFTKVPGDLNAGAGGQYVYVCYSTTA